MNKKIKDILYISLAIVFSNTTFFFGVWLSGYIFERGPLAAALFVFYIIYNLLCISVPIQIVFDL